MINITSSTQLGIILPNTNKALAQVLSSATPHELELISKGKDLKSIMSTILKRSGTDSLADKELLQLVKNNPTLKNLGDVSTTIKDLLNLIKSDKNPLPIEKVLNNFLTDIKDLKNSELKQKLENSGVFLESRLKDAKNPQVELKNLLITLAKTLESNKTPSNKAIINEIKLLLNSETIKSASNSALTNNVKENPKTLQQLASSVESLVTKLKAQIKGADAIHNPALTKALEKLEHITQPKSLTPENFKLSSLKESLQQVSASMSKSFTMESKGILEALDKIFNSIKIVEQNVTSSKPFIEQVLIKKIPSDISKIIDNIKANTIQTADLNKSLEKLEHIIQPKSLTPENFKLSSLTEALQQVSTNISKNFTIESKGILGALEKIFQALKVIEQSATSTKPSIEQLLSKNVPMDISKLSENIKNLILKADPIFSKDTALILNKLENLNTAQKLNPQNNVKEILSNDFKAVLLQAGEEIAKSPQANQNEILKNIDKLSLQIDHYQLLSHLSNGTSLYLPFSWDMLEEGNIEMKKSDDDKFYCDIDLKLKDYGELNLKLTLFEKNQLNLHIYSSNKEFKKIMQDSIPSLRSALIDTQITPREIRFFEPKSKRTNSPYGAVDDELHMGFEVKA